MRLLGVLVATLLATSTSYADPLPFEVIRVLPETAQVLVYDRANHTHVLLAPGATFYDYAIVEIRGMGMIVEKQQERIAMYPRAAQEISVSSLSPHDQVQPPAIFGRVTPAPTPAPTQVAARREAKDTDPKVALELASLLTTATAKDRPQRSSRPRVANSALVRDR